jgi:two-component system LytT family response regulator
MKIAIIEDEKPAASMLEMLIKKIDPSTQVLAVIPSVAKSVEWLKNNAQQVDVIFMDIQLTDGICFEIFKEIQVAKPIIFTTAYDEYALEAFKVNSIDYLLKPVKLEALTQSINKLRALQPTLQTTTIPDYKELLNLLTQKQQSYPPRIMVKVGEHIKSIKLEDTTLFFAEGRTVFIVTNEKRKYIVDYTLEELTSMLDPKLFFRCNRTYIININAITDVVVYSSTRLKIRLPKEFEDEIIVSRERVPLFKSWFGGIG